MRRQVIREPGRILGGLRFDASERSVTLGLDGAERFAIQIKEVVGEAESRFHLEFADGDAASRGQVDFVAILDKPAGCRQIEIDLAPCLLFGRVGHVL